MLDYIIKYLHNLKDFFFSDSDLVDHGKPRHKAKRNRKKGSKSGPPPKRRRKNRD